MPTRSVELNPERLAEASSFMVAAMNKGQRAGFTVDEMIAAALFMCGVGIKQRGGILALDKPLRQALPPIAMGYEEAAHAEPWQIAAMQGN